VLPSLGDWVKDTAAPWHAAMLALTLATMVLRMSVVRVPATATFWLCVQLYVQSRAGGGCMQPLQVMAVRAAALFAFGAWPLLSWLQCVCCSSPTRRRDDGSDISALLTAARRLEQIASDNHSVLLRIEHLLEKVRDELA
jgi:hypothetical protein